jgi:hypothetical protein
MSGEGQKKKKKQGRTHECARWAIRWCIMRAAIIQVKEVMNVQDEQLDGASWELQLFQEKHGL